VKPWLRIFDLALRDEVLRVDFLHLEDTPTVDLLVKFVSKISVFVEIH
jgi:hypothetical protein